MKIPIFVQLERKLRPVFRYLFNKKKSNIIFVEKIVSSIYKAIIPSQGIFYIGREETGPFNIKIRTDRKESGCFFEWPEGIATNKAIVDLLLPEDKTIVSIGAGVGTFELLAATQYPDRKFIASEFDQDCVTWCRQNRQFENVEFTSMDFQQLKKRHDVFDCLVSVDVIEHVKDFSSFLRECVALAPRAIIATPNKDRSIEQSIAPIPLHIRHTQEWDAGEFYWILKCFYKNVTLYSITEYENSENFEMNFKYKRVGLMSVYPKLIAVCEV